MCHCKPLWHHAHRFQDDGIRHAYNKYQSRPLFRSDRVSCSLLQALSLQSHLTLLASCPVLQSLQPHGLQLKQCRKPVSGALCMFRLPDKFLWYLRSIRGILPRDPSAVKNHPHKCQGLCRSEAWFRSHRFLRWEGMQFPPLRYSGSCIQNQPVPDILPFPALNVSSHTAMLYR